MCSCSEMRRKFKALRHNKTVLFWIVIFMCWMYRYIVVGPPCKDKVKMSKIVTADMLNCFTIKLPSPNLKMTVVGAVITVYLDNLPIQPPQVLPYNLASDFGSSEGKLKEQSI